MFTYHQDNVERILKEEQAGFRECRSCVDQMFVQSTIIEQSLELSIELNSKRPSTVWLVDNSTLAPVTLEGNQHSLMHV